MSWLSKQFGGKAGDKTPSKSPESKTQTKPAPTRTVKMPLVEVFLAVRPDGQEMYEKDKEQALR